MINSNGVDKHLVTGFSGMRSDLEVKDSSIQGKGLFTQVELPRGEILFEIVGEKMRHRYEPSWSGQNPNWIGTGYEEWLTLGPGDIAIFLNHSCHPNVIINEKLELVTISPVKANQELLLDYSTTELDPYWKMDCICGAPDCRKILRSFQFLPENVQKKYEKYLAPMFASTAKVLAEHQRVS